MEIKNKVHRVKPGSRPFQKYEDPISECEQRLLDTEEYFSRTRGGAICRVREYNEDDYLIREPMTEHTKDTESYGYCPECEAVWEEKQARKGLQLLADLDRDK